MAQVMLAYKCKALSSNPNATKKCYFITLYQSRSFNLESICYRGDLKTIPDGPVVVFVFCK
jgi:hypothetical protein